MDDNQWEENGDRTCVSAVMLAFEDTETDLLSSFNCCHPLCVLLVIQPRSDTSAVFIIQPIMASLFPKQAPVSRTGCHQTDE